MTIVLLLDSISHVNVTNTILNKLIYLGCYRVHDSCFYFFSIITNDNRIVLYRFAASSAFPPRSLAAPPIAAPQGPPKKIQSHPQHFRLFLYFEDFIWRILKVSVFLHIPNRNRHCLNRRHCFRTVFQHVCRNCVYSSSTMLLAALSSSRLNAASSSRLLGRLSMLASWVTTCFALRVNRRLTSDFFASTLCLQRRIFAREC